MEGGLERLAALRPSEADDRSIEVDVLEPKQPHTRVPGRRRHEDRHDRSVAEIERPVSDAAPLERTEVLDVALFVEVLRTEGAD